MFQKTLLFFGNVSTVGGRLWCEDGAGVPAGTESRELSGEQQVRIYMKIKLTSMEENAMTPKTISTVLKSVYYNGGLWGI